MRQRIVVYAALMGLLLATGGGSVGGSAFEIYYYYYPDATFSGTPVGYCAENDSCTDYDYCSGDTSTQYRVWEKFNCLHGGGSCGCQQFNGTSWGAVECPSTTLCER